MQVNHGYDILDRPGVAVVIMPVSYIGFALKPVGFFDRNPALDVARPMLHGGNGHAGHNGHTEGCELAP